MNEETWEFLCNNSPRLVVKSSRDKTPEQPPNSARSAKKSSFNSPRVSRVKNSTSNCTRTRLRTPVFNSRKSKKSQERDLTPPMLPPRLLQIRSYTNKTIKHNKIPTTNARHLSPYLKRISNSPLTSGRAANSPSITKTTRKVERLYISNKK